MWYVETVENLFMRSIQYILEHMYEYVFLFIFLLAINDDSAQ